MLPWTDRCHREPGAGLSALRCGPSAMPGRMESCAFVSRLFGRGRSGRHRWAPCVSSDVVLCRLEQQDACLRDRDAQARRLARASGQDGLHLECRRNCCDEDGSRVQSLIARRPSGGRSSSETRQLQTNNTVPARPTLVAQLTRRSMSNRRFLTTFTTVAIAVGSLALTTGGAFAAAPPPPHYKPLICAFLPFLCSAPIAKPKPVHHHKQHTMMKTTKPKAATKPKY